MTIKVNGLDKLINDLKRVSKEAERMTNDNLNKSAVQIAFKATRNAPNFVKPLIRRDKLNNGKTWRVYVDNADDPLPAYWEFGTGLSAKIILAPYPESIKALAMTYYVNGMGTLRGSPYFFPAYFEEAPKLIENLKRDLEKLKL